MDKPTFLALRPEIMFPMLRCTEKSVALRLGQQIVTYGQLASRVGHYVQRLDARGIASDARVGVWTDRSIETVVALVGNFVSGRVSVPLNPASGEGEIAHVLNDALPTHLVGGNLPDTARGERHARTKGWAHIWLDDLDDSVCEPPVRTPSDDAPALILYTSGTTGLPKGAVITFGNVLSNLDALATVWQWTSSDTLVHALPLFHVHGLVLGLFGCLRRGCMLVWLARFEIDLVCDAFEQGATMMFGVPTMYHRLGEALDQHPDARWIAALGRARLLVSGSAPLPVREILRLQRFTGKRVIQRYGLTETLINCSEVVDETAVPGSVGRPLPGIEIDLVDEKGASITVPDVMGEVLVRGPNVFDGYLNRTDATREVLDANRWFRTGDLARFDTDGSVHVAGRKSTDLIKTGGYKVGAGEVEAALLEHPSVRECAVVARASDDLGETIHAFVVVRETDSVPTASELIEHVARWLAPHKRPREISFVTELPRNAMGKVLKSVLRALPRASQ